MPEKVEDEQLKSKEIFDQIQPESKEILDQVQPESKEILDQNQPKSEEILDQIQPKSEENLDQPDDRSKNELEDSENKDWHDHKENNLKQKLERLKEKLEILKNKWENNQWENNQWKNQGIERKIERIQQRTRRNSQYALIDIANDIEESFISNLSIVKDKLKSFVENELNKEIPEFVSSIKKFFTQIVENKNEKVEKLEEKFKKIIEKIEEYINIYEEDIKDKGTDFFKNVVEKLKDDAKEIIENLKEQPNQEIKNIFNTLKHKIKEATYLFEDIVKFNLEAKMKVIYNVLENFKKTVKPIALNFIKNKINNFKDAKQIITDVGTSLVEKMHGYIKEGIKIVENESGKIDNIVKETKEHFNDIKEQILKPTIKEVIEESKNKVGGILNISKKIEEKLPFNLSRDSSKGILSKIKRD